MKRLIVFDLDHTLIKVNSSYAFGSYLFSQNYFSLTQMILSLADYIRYQLFGLSIQKLHQKSFNRLFKNFSSSKLQQLVYHFLGKNLNRFLDQSVYTRLKAEQFKGNDILLLSSSPDFLVQPIADFLGLNNWGATTYQINEKGELANLVQVMDGKQKASYLINYLKSSSISLSLVTAYSDSYLDLPLLEIANQAVGVNPDKRLKKICQKNQWEIFLSSKSDE